MPEPLHHGVLTAEIVFVVRVLVPYLKPLKRELTGRERLLRCWAVDGLDLALTPTVVEALKRHSERQAGPKTSPPAVAACRIGS
jgi:hypothetical protein